MARITGFLGRSAGMLLVGLVLLWSAGSRLAPRMHAAPDWGQGLRTAPASHLLLVITGLVLAGGGAYGLFHFFRLFFEAAREVEAEQAAAPARRRVPDAQAVLAAERAQTVRPAAPVTSAPPPPPAPADQSVESAEAIAWLAQQPARVRDCIAAHWHWETDLRVLKWLVEQEDCDAGTAAGVFWVSGAAEDFVPFGSEEPYDEQDLLTAAIEDVIGRRFAAGSFVRHQFGFDVGWPFEAWVPRLRQFHAVGRIDWNPDAIPTTASRGACGLDDLSAEEAAAATGFLEEFARA